jgi:hypothetical protein
MTLAYKRIEDVEETDLTSLVTFQVAEGKLIEYKLQMPGASDNEKKEFLADISSFANASGGDIVYGMREEYGVAAELVSLPSANLDMDLLRLEEIIRNGVAPRIPGVVIKPVKLESSGAVLVIRIPRSYALPHMVTFKGGSRFFSRNSGGKYQMDVSEIRSTFLLVETFAERARNFRAERLGNLVAGETPVKLDDPPLGVLHIVPVRAFDPGVRFDLSELVGKTDRLLPMPNNVGSLNAPRFNFDGLICHTVLGERASGYVQLFRNGIVEAVLADIKNPTQDERKEIPGEWFEEQLITYLPIYLRTLRAMGVEPPLFLMFSMLGVSDFVFQVGEHFRRYRYNQIPIDRDALLIPEVMLESFDVTPTVVLRPVFDAVWNAAGWVRSMNYDENGTWRSR